MLKHQEHHFDNSQTEGFVDTLCDQWSEFTVHFYLECKKGSKQFCTNFNSKVGVQLMHECDLYSSKYGTFVCYILLSSLNSLR